MSHRSVDTSNWRYYNGEINDKAIVLSLFGVYSRQMTLEAGAIAVGIILASCIAGLCRRAKTGVAKYGGTAQDSDRNHSRKRSEKDERKLGRNVTRNDVARLAGVSPAVVSYVINQTRFVSEEKTNAVKKAIEELQYRPNLHARSLKTNRSMQIAFVCDNLRNDWLEIAEKMFFDKGYFVSHCYSRDGGDFIQMLIEGRFDGVFMLSNRYTANQLNEIAGAGIPIVLYKTRDYSFLKPNIVTVAPDIYGGMMKTINYLIARGHERIILAPPLRYNMNLRKGYRERAYKEALEANGLEYREALVCKNTDSIEFVFSTLFDLIFSNSPEERPTAIVAGDDYLAGQIMQYLKKLGVRIPEDVAIVGMDNTYLSDMLTPTLSSIDFSKEEFSEKLVDRMLRLLRGEQPEHEWINVSLSVRESA